MDPRARVEGQERRVIIPPESSTQTVPRDLRQDAGQHHKTEIPQEAGLRRRRREMPGEIKNRTEGDVLDAPVAETPPSHAGDEGRTPDRGTKIPHAAG